MDYWISKKDDDDWYKHRLTGNQKDMVYQIIISLIVGTLAFASFLVRAPVATLMRNFSLIISLDTAPEMAFAICCA